eukprot:PLAT14712.1.p1 GENE.PLAT14712.1~~PLAT14712.1.p1  ORF type:complete len:347 (+),score=164.85 PLAT14712.1:18-1058(+)
MLGLPPPRRRDWFFIFVIVLLLGLLGLQVFGQENKRLAYRPTEEWPAVDHLWFAAASCVALSVARLLLSRAFQPLGRLLIPAHKWGAEQYVSRVERFGAVCFKLLYFLVVTTWGFHLLSPQAWFPRALGGSQLDNIANALWEGFPRVAPVTGVRIYYMTQCGYHLQSLLFTLFTKKRTDLYEMTAHHLVAVLLILLSYLYGHYRIGCLVFFLHDASDISSYFVKAAVDTPYTAVTLTAYALLLASWGYLRLYILPAYIITAYWLWDDSHLSEVPERITLISMLFVLLVLHMYWYYMFLDMGYGFIIKGKGKGQAADVQDAELTGRGVDLDAAKTDSAAAKADKKND